MFLMLFKLVDAQNNIAKESIDHKFMMFGYFSLPNDVELLLIEAASRQKQHIYIPETGRKLL